MFLSLTKGYKRVVAQWRPELRCIAALMILFFGAQLAAYSQTVNATLRGTVLDTSGSVVSGADLTLIEPATGQVVRHITSISSGDFEFDELKPGTYQLRCAATGFKVFVAQNIVLDSGQIRRVDATLPLGEVSEEVTVSAGAAVINTESATISGTFTARQHDESPQVTTYPTTYSMLTTLSGVQVATVHLSLTGNSSRSNPKRSTASRMTLPANRATMRASLSRSPRPFSTHRPRVPFPSRLTR